LIYTGKEWTVDLDGEDLLVKEILLSDGKSKGLTFPCPCGRGIILSSKAGYDWSDAGGLTIRPQVVHRTGPGTGVCQWNALVEKGAVNTVLYKEETE
jgi:hypothetical protein